MIVSAHTKLKSLRLMDWWIARPADADPLAYAQHCAAFIEKRGVKELPPMGGVENARKERQIG